MIAGTVGVTKAEDLKAIEEKVERKLLEVAARELGLSEDQLVVRDADPESDFGLTNKIWTFSATSANAYNTYVNTTVGDNKFIGVYGIGRGSDNFTLVKFSSGAKTLDIWDCDPAELNTNFKVKLAKAPVIFRQNMPMKIEVYATTTGSIDAIVFAKVCEPKGKTISP